MSRSRSNDKKRQVGPATGKPSAIFTGSPPLSGIHVDRIRDFDGELVKPPKKKKKK